jgi:hypothetical protein
VKSDVGIACERPIYFDYHGTIQDGSTAVGAPEPETKWYFAEASNRPGFDTYLCVQNSGDKTANVAVTLPSATQTAPRTTIQVGAMSRYTLPLKNNLVAPVADFGIIVSSDVPVVCERPMYVDAAALRGGDTAMGITVPETTWSFAEGTTRVGFETFISLLNPNGQPTIAHLLYQFPDSSTADRICEIPANSRLTINVSGDVGECHDVATTITADLPIVAERPMYFDLAYHGGSVATGFGVR